MTSNYKRSIEAYKIYTPTVCLAILTMNRPKVLNRTLESYKMNGFLDIFDEKIILIQGNHSESRKVAEKYFELSETKGNEHR